MKIQNNSAPVRQVIYNAIHCLNAHNKEISFTGFALPVDDLTIYSGNEFKKTVYGAIILNVGKVSLTQLSDETGFFCGENNERVIDFDFFIIETHKPDNINRYDVYYKTLDMAINEAYKKVERVTNEKVLENGKVRIGVNKASLNASDSWFFYFDKVVGVNIKSPYPWMLRLVVDMENGKTLFEVEQLTETKRKDFIELINTGDPVRIAYATVTA